MKGKHHRFNNDNIAHDHNQDHIMRERDNHIATAQAPSPAEDYSHIIMVRKKELLMERCSPEEMEAVAAKEPTTGGGPLSPLLPWSWC